MATDTQTAAPPQVDPFAPPPSSGAEKTVMDPAAETPLFDRQVKYKPLGETIEIELNVGLVRRFLCKPTWRGRWPSDIDVVRFMMLCQARFLNPWVGDAFCLGYEKGENEPPDFNLVTSIQALHKRAELSNLCEWHKAGVVIYREKTDEIIEREGTIVLPKETLVGGWARVKRSDRTDVTYIALQLSTYTTGKSRWKKDPAGMIRKCALAAGLRETFPNNTGGLYVADEFADDAMPGSNTQDEATIPSQQPESVNANDLFDGYDDAKVGGPPEAPNPDEQIDAEFEVTGKAAETPPAEKTPKRERKTPKKETKVPPKEDKSSPKQETTDTAKPGKQKTLDDGEGAFEPEELVENVKALYACKTASEVSEWKKKELELGSDAGSVRKLSEEHLNTIMG